MGISPFETKATVLPSLAAVTVVALWSQSLGSELPAPNAACVVASAHTKAAMLKSSLVNLQFFIAFLPSGDRASDGTPGRVHCPFPLPALNKTGVIQICD
jgi:hypothetical protein